MPVSRRVLAVLAVSFAIPVAVAVTAWLASGRAGQRGRRALRALAATAASAAAWLVLASATFVLFEWLATLVNRFGAQCGGWRGPGPEPAMMPLWVVYAAALGLPTLIVGLYWAMGERRVWARLPSVVGAVAAAVAAAFVGLVLTPVCT